MNIDVAKSNVPLVLKDFIKNWPLLIFDETKWSELFKGKSLTFRKGSKCFRSEPLWESQCEDTELTLEEFFKLSKVKNSEFLYYDYKYIQSLCEDGNVLVEGIRWADVGFPEFSGKESTLWIGNEGAHTPCHVDSYGFNLVAQIYGRKMWLLMPPTFSDSMRPTRVPYEESSIYSKINFYTPTNDLKGIETIYKVILEPGDVLYVPRHWWHYVENLDVAISVNVWIPSVGDDESRLEEALVQKFVSNFCQDLTEDEAMKLINPNQKEILTETLKDEVILAAARQCLLEREIVEKDLKDLGSQKRLMPKNIVQVDSMRADNVDQYLRTKEEDHGYKCDSVQIENSIPNLAELLINAFCHPHTIESVKEKLLHSLH